MPDIRLFAGTHYPGVNGPMWTISYEFRCYLLVAVLGLVGCLDAAPILLSLASLCFLAAHLIPAGTFAHLDRAHLHPDIWVGDPVQTARLTGMFLSGATFRAYQHKIPLSPIIMAVCGAALVALLFSASLAEIGVAISGSYLIFAAAAFGRGTWLERINNKNDISYGVYLYAWPIEKLLVGAGLFSSLFLLGLVTWLAALAMGALSWFIIEKPVMRKVRPVHP